MKQNKPNTEILQLIIKLIENQEKVVPEFVEKLKGKTLSEKLQYFIKDNFYTREIIESKSEEFTNVLIQYALHKYSYQVDLDTNDDTLDSIATAINLLGEELNHSTITRHYLEDIFNSIDNMLFVVDDYGFIDSMNTNTSVRLGYKADEISRQKIESLLEPEIPFKKLLKTYNNSQTLSFRKANNELIPVELIISNFVRGDNNRIGYVIIARDISELLHYQREIETQNLAISLKNKELNEALERAEESDKLKTAFLQNISHEIRTPLNVITGLIQLINNFEISPEERFEYSGIMEKSSRRLIEIINNVLDISRIETGQLKVTFRNFSINTVIKDIYSAFYLEAKEKGIQLEYYAPFTDGDDIIETDNGKLNQVITNLVKNSIKFTESGCVEFGYEAKDNELMFFVKDSGIGIDSAMQDRIFERFVQVENNFGKLYDGAGLGLSISKGLVELLGGSIWFESISGKGTDFYFTIPHQSINKTGQSEIKKPSYEIGNRSLKIIIAEDDDLNFLYFDKMMKSLKHEVYRAKNGLEAIQLCKALPNTDVILMDIKMPEMDGVEATRIIKTFNTETPIIALTAFAFNEERETILAAGFDEYVSKPIRIETLFIAIKKCLNL